MRVKLLHPLAAKDMTWGKIALLHIGKGLVALFLAMWATIPVAIVSLWGFCMLDYVLGIAVAWKWKVVSGAAARDGLLKKVAVCFTPFVFHWAEGMVGKEIGAENYAATMLGLSEVISVVENLAYLGVPIPSNVVSLLAAAKKLVPRSMTPDEIKAELDDEPKSKSAGA